jgi:hypothetical protein
VTDVTARSAGEVAYRRPAQVAYVVDHPQEGAADGVTVLLHLPSGRRTSLSPTGGAVWAALVAAGEAGASAAELAPGLAAAYGADPDQVEADVRGLLEQLAGEGLVEPA